MKVVDIHGGPPREPDPQGTEIEQLACHMVHVLSLPALPVKQRFSILLNRTCKTLGMDYGYITLPQEPVAAVPFASAKMVLRPPGPGRLTLSHLLTRRRSPIHFDDPDGAPEGEFIDQTGYEPYRFVGSPISFDGRVFGTVEFGSARAGAAPFGTDALMLVRVLSGLAAGSLVLLAD